MSSELRKFRRANAPEQWETVAGKIIYGKAGQGYFSKRKSEKRRRQRVKDEIAEQQRKEIINS